MPLAAPPFCCSLLIMTSSDSGEQGRGMRRGGGSWSASGGPYFEMFSIIIFKKVCFVGSGLLNSYRPPPIKPLDQT